LRRQVPICWFNLRPVIRLRVAVIPQRWPARRADVRGLGVDPDVIKGDGAVVGLDKLKKPDLVVRAESLLVGSGWLPEPLR
jgi:hypothetical protein